MTHEEMTVFISDKNTNKMRSILKNEVTVYEVFKYNGTLFKGNALNALIEYFYNTQGKEDLYVWLQDNRKVIIK